MEGIAEAIPVSDYEGGGLGWSDRRLGGRGGRDAGDGVRFRNRNISRPRNKTIREMTGVLAFLEVTNAHSHISLFLSSLPVSPVF